MSEHRYGVHDCPNGFYYLRDVTDHSVYIHRDYGYLYSPYKEDIELVSTLLNELANKVDEQQGIIEEKNNVIILMGAFIKSKGFSVNDFDEWISKDWHNANERYEEHYKEH